jgi:RNA polymerase sigma factor (sigma-70 family)
MHEASRGQVAHRVVDAIAGREVVRTVGQLAHQLVQGELCRMDVEQDRQHGLFGLLLVRRRRGFATARHARAGQSASNRHAAVLARTRTPSRSARPSRTNSSTAASTVSRGRAFSSFAVPTIVGEIKRYYRDKTWSVNVPRDLQDRVLAVDRAVRELESELARKPTVAELADRLSLTDEDILEALHANQGRRAASLDAPYDGDDASLGDSIATRENGFHRAEQRASLARLTAILTPREQRILALRFGADLTQAEIGQHMELSQMQISRILRQAITKLRAYATAQSTHDLAA